MTSTPLCAHLAGCASACTEHDHLVVRQQEAKSLPEADLAGAACLGAAFLGDSLLLANWEPTELSKNPPEEAFVGGECLGAGAAFLGDSDLLANWEPTELSKNPPPEEPLVGEDCLGAGADFLGDSLLLANWEPTELSKKPPPPEEAFVGEDCLGAGGAFLGDSDLLANWEPTELSKNPLEEPAAQRLNVRVWAKVGPSKHDIMHNCSTLWQRLALPSTCNILFHEQLRASYQAGNNQLIQLLRCWCSISEYTSYYKTVQSCLQTVCLNIYNKSCACSFGNCMRTVACAHMAVKHW